jgi:hypothetical protein
MNNKYNYNDIIKRVHPDWLIFLKENKNELEIILNSINNISFSKKYI